MQSVMRLGRSLERRFCYDDSVSSVLGDNHGKETILIGQYIVIRKSDRSHVRRISMMRPQQFNNRIHELAQSHRLNLDRQTLILLQFQPKAIDILGRQLAIDGVVERDGLRLSKIIVEFNFCDVRKRTNEHAAKIRDATVVSNLRDVLTQPTVVRYRHDHLDRFRIDNLERFCRDAFIVKQNFESIIESNSRERKLALVPTLDASRQNQMQLGR